MSKAVSKDKWRLVTEIAFLLVFVGLLRGQALQSWILIFGVGVLGSLLFGRLYCAWICPMATLFRPIDWLYRKLKIKRRSTPAFFKKTWVRWGILLLFVGVMVVTKRLGIKLNLLLLAVLSSIAITLIFEETFWHRHICPYGTLLHVFSKSAYLGVTINEDTCIACGLCQKVCPNSSIVTLDSRKRRIENDECLTCFKCQDVCPVHAVQYSKTETKGKGDHRPTRPQKLSS